MINNNSYSLYININNAFFYNNLCIKLQSKISKIRLKILMSIMSNVTSKNIADCLKLYFLL